VDTPTIAGNGQLFHEPTWTVELTRTLWKSPIASIANNPCITCEVAGPWTIALLATLSLFDISSGSLLAFALSSILCLGISRMPHKSRQVLREWKKWKEEESLKELIDQNPKE
jgi:hypothetical protein